MIYLLILRFRARNGASYTEPLCEKNGDNIFSRITHKVLRLCKIIKVVWQKEKMERNVLSLAVTYFKNYYESC